MNSWTYGYVSEVEYTHGYYPELNPLRVAMPFLNVGLAPPEIRTACELGFGQGLSLNIHAASTPVEWYGTDFNPTHAGSAQSLAALSGSGARLFDESFAEFCNRPDLPDFDFIGLHGIWSWISAENHRVIVDFLRRKLKVGGVLYISYNTHPGSAGMVPLRHLMMQHADAIGGAGRGIVTRIEAALGFANQLVQTNPIFAVAHPSIIERLKQMQAHNRNYLAHEYFNRDWCVMLFAEMVDILSEAKLSFACSAHYLDHIDAVNLQPDQQKFLGEIADPLFRQSIRDFMINQQFRRDYWVKGGRRLPALEQTEALRKLRVLLVAAPRTDITFSIPSPFGPREMNRRLYDALLDILADHRPITLGELEQRLGSAGLRLGAIYEAVMVLTGKGDVVVVQDDLAQQTAKPHSDALNQRLFDRARATADVQYIASPVIGGGVLTPRFSQLFLLGLREGRATADELARFAWDIVSRQGQRLLKEGKALETEGENLAELMAMADEFVSKRLDLLKVLQIA